MKKMVCALLAASMILGLTACGNRGGKESTGGTAAATSENQKGNSEIKKLKAHFIGTPQNDMKQVNAAINEYTIKNLGLEVEIVLTDFGDFDQKSQLIINTGEDYDIIFTCSWANDYLTNARKGAFLDLTPYLEQEKFKPLYDTISPAFWEGASVDGSIYAVPTQKEIALMPLYTINEELAKKYEFDYTEITKLSEFEPFLQQVQANEPEVTPFMLLSDRTFKGPYDYILGLGYPLAVIIEGEDKGKVVNMYDLPDVKEYVYTVRDFFKKGYINQDAVTRTGELKKGELYALSFGDGQPYAEVTWSDNSGFPIKTQEMSSPVATTSTTRGAMMGINKNSKNPEAALEFIQAVNTDSTLHNLLNYGLEGVHYEKLSDNQIKRTEAGLDNYLVSTFGLGNLFNTYVLDGEPEDKWEVFQKENDEALRSPLLGLDIDTTSIKNELAAISNLTDQYEPLIQTGSVDPDQKIAEFKKKLEEVGFQKVMEEVQKQVDEFLANN